MASFRTWKKQFKAYYDAAHLGALPCTQQQAYLNNCLDNALRARVDREATGNTPVYFPIVGLIMCIAILDNTFLEKLEYQTLPSRKNLGQSRIPHCPRSTRRPRDMSRLGRLLPRPLPLVTRLSKDLPNAAPQLDKLNLRCALELCAAIAFAALRTTTCFRIAITRKT